VWARLVRRKTAEVKEIVGAVALVHGRVLRTGTQPDFAELLATWLRAAMWSSWVWVRKMLAQVEAGLSVRSCKIGLARPSRVEEGGFARDIRPRSGSKLTVMPWLWGDGTEFAPKA